MAYVSTCVFQCSSYTYLPKFRNYIIYCANHPSNQHRGGSAVIIKSSPPHHNLGAYTTNSITTAVHFNHHDINVGSIYCPPRCTPNDSEFINLFISLGSRWIISGDFNAKHLAWGFKTDFSSRSLCSTSSQLNQ